MKDLADQLIRAAEKLTNAENRARVLHIIYDAYHNATLTTCVEKTAPLDQFDNIFILSVASLLSDRDTINGHVKRFFSTRGIRA